MKQSDYPQELADIDGLPAFKNSAVYNSPDWREWNDLSAGFKFGGVFPVQRKLTAHECVFDLDHVSTYHMTAIPRYLKETGLKFIAWKSGPDGMHVHFWVNMTGKHQKKALVTYMAERMETMFGVKNDLGPMGHGCIRTEFSVHPVKGYQKEHLMTNLSVLFPINELPAKLIEKVEGLDLSDTLKASRNAERDGKCPQCVKYILSHKFSDGRERLLFSIVSWYNACGYTESEIYSHVKAWCAEQNYTISRGALWSKIKSSSGGVGCTWRHAVLEELGVDMSKCRYVK